MTQQDTGALRDRVAAAMMRHHIDPNRTTADRADVCVCGGWTSGEMSPGWDEHLAEVAVDVLVSVLGTLAARDARLTAERDRLRLAWTSARRGRAQATSGVDYLLGEVDTAMKAVDQLLKERDAARLECEELRRALRSALSSPDEPGVHTTLSHMRRLAGLDDAPARPDLVDLPAEDLVEPGDEVPAIAELDGRLVDLENRLRPIEYTFGPEVWSDDAAPGGMVCSRASSTGSGGICGMPVESEPCPEHSLDGRLNAMQDQINAMLARVEDRLSPPTTQAAPTPAQVRDAAGDLSAAPAEFVRYRDRHGDLWERTDPFMYVLVETEGDDTGGAIFARPLKYVRDTYGPLTPEPTAPAEAARSQVTIYDQGGTPLAQYAHPPTPCEVCGRTPADQEHGPDGQCRHTPATRLGRPGGDR